MIYGKDYDCYSEKFKVMNTLITEYVFSDLECAFQTIYERLPKDVKKSL